MKKQTWTKVGMSEGPFGGVVVRNEKGFEQTLLSPSQKGAKFAQELHFGCKMQNNGVAKRDPSDPNYPIHLSDTEAAFRSGYLKAQQDNAKAYKSKHPRYTSKKK